MKKWGFISSGITYLQYCNDCRRENYSMNVMTGCCTWCGAGPCSEVSQKKGGDENAPETHVSDTNVGDKK